MQKPSPTIVTIEASSIDRRSPIRVAGVPDGMFVTRDPMPTSAAMTAATASVAPRWTAKHDHGQDGALEQPEQGRRRKRGDGDLTELKFPARIRGLGHDLHRTRLAWRAD